MAQSKLGIAHTALLRTELANSGGKEVVVWDTEYEPGAINARHLHPSAIYFLCRFGNRCLVGGWQTAHHFTCRGQFVSACWDYSLTLER
jgi:hypothetical protein